MEIEKIKAIVGSKENFFLNHGKWHPNNGKSVILFEL